MQICIVARVLCPVACTCISPTMYNLSQNVLSAASNSPWKSLWNGQNKHLKLKKNATYHKVFIMHKIICKNFRVLEISNFKISKFQSFRVLGFAKICNFRNNFHTPFPATRLMNCHAAAHRTTSLDKSWRHKCTFFSGQGAQVCQFVDVILVKHIVFFSPELAGSLWLATRRGLNHGAGWSFQHVFKCVHRLGFKVWAATPGGVRMARRRPRPDWQWRTWPILPLGIWCLRQKLMQKSFAVFHTLGKAKKDAVCRPRQTTSKPNSCIPGCSKTPIPPFSSTA